VWRTGLIAQAVEIKFDTFLALNADLRLADGREHVVRHGHAPARTIQPGIGPVEVHKPKARDRRAAEAGKRIRFTSAILPKWAGRTKSLDALLTALYLRGISAGDFQEVRSPSGLSPYAVIERGTMDQLDLYDQQAAKDDGVFTEPPLALQVRDNFIIDQIRRMQGREGRTLQVTELSIGGGHLSHLLCESCNIDLLCAEISPRRIESVKRRLSASPYLAEKKVAFVECNFDTQFDALPASASDVVIALDILEHVFDVFCFIANCHKILRPGGLLLLRTPNVAFIRHRVGLLFGRLPITASWFGPLGELKAWRDNYSWDGGHLHLFNIPILRKLLEEQGFLIGDFRDAGARLEWIRNLWPNLLYANPLIIAKKHDVGRGK
jgi:SAM-dependent methyltransferase